MLMTSLAVPFLGLLGTVGLVVSVIAMADRSRS